MTLTELIERLEKADAGSRKLDWAIAEVLGEVPKHSIRPVGFDYDWYRSSETTWSLWKAKDSEGRSADLWQPKQRTTSLDAALTILPEGWTPSILLPPDMGAEVRLFRHAIGLNVHDAIKLDIVVEAATGPLAACIAFLKARAGKDTA